MAHLKATAAKLGLALGDRKMTYNSRLAQEVGLWAETKGHGHKFHMEAFKAYFVDGKNIAQTDVLLNLIENSGLDPKEGKTIIETRAFQMLWIRIGNFQGQKVSRPYPAFFSDWTVSWGRNPMKPLRNYW